MSLNGKVVLVTGATSGMGKVCAEYFVEHAGATVVAASNQREEGEALEKESAAAGRAIRFMYLDQKDEASVQRLVEQVVSEFGRIDAVHLNAGVWGQGKVTDFDDEQWDLIMGVNVKGVFWLAKHLVPVMEKQGGGGVMLITTSVAAFIGFPQHSLYCASKAALDALVRCLATDHAGVVRVVGICPGTIDTPMLAASCQGWDKPVAELYAEVEKRIPVRRLGQPIDIAKAAAFLLSDDADYVNATSLVMDGGTMALPPW